RRWRWTHRWRTCCDWTLRAWAWTRRTGRDRAWTGCTRRARISRPCIRRAWTPSPFLARPLVVLRRRTVLGMVRLLRRVRVGLRLRFCHAASLRSRLEAVADQNRNAYLQPLMD